MVLEKTLGSPLDCKEINQSILKEISSSNEYSGLISFRVDWLISLQSKGLSGVLSNTIAQNHQFFGAQLSLWSTSHVHN